jgi:hypothetical protein
MTLDEFGSKYELFVKRVTEALEALSREAEFITAKQIYDWVSQKYPEDVKLLDPSWGSHMSAATRDKGTKICRVPGRYTYRYAQKELEPSQALAGAGESSDSPAALDAAQVAPERARYTKREAALYPTLRDWLSGRGFRAEDTSAGRAHGTWGNPDVTGIRIVEGYVGNRELEVVSIEAKASTTNWKQLIFEAVSHKRFAHRAYFAVAFGSDEPSLSSVPDAEELRQYAERFRVGVLVVFLPTEVYDKLTQGREGEIQINSTEVAVEELWPAVFEPTRSVETTSFLMNLGLKTDQDLYEFGLN